MIERVANCSFHDTEQELDRANVRRHLRTVTREVLNTVTDVGEDRTFAEFAISIGSYSDYTAKNTPMFDRIMKLPTFANAKGRFDEYVTSNTSSLYDKPILNSPFIPVGEYGQGVASRLLVGTVRALELVQDKDQRIREIALQSPINQEVILNHTFQGHITGDAEKGLAILTQQGIISTAQSLALLTAQRIQGEDREDLAAKLVEADRVTEFARRIGPGLLPYLAIFGRYITDPIKTRGGVPYITPELMSEVRVNRDGARVAAEDAQRKLGEISLRLTAALTEGDPELAKSLQESYYTEHLIAFSGTTCPAANRQGEITETARLILQLMPKKNRA